MATALMFDVAGRAATPDSALIFFSTLAITLYVHGAFGGSQSFSWTPAYDESGNYSVTFTITDDGNPMLSDSETIVVSVGEVNRPPVLDHR